MAQALRAAITISPMCTPFTPAYRSHQALPKAHFSVVCCQSTGRDAQPDVSRRSFALGGAAAAAGLAFLNQPEVQAKRQPPPPPTEKRPEDDPNLSAYDARLLASYRRKEALKASVEAKRAQAAAQAGSSPQTQDLATVKMQ